jgi:hypothetical protein
MNLQKVEILAILFLFSWDCLPGYSQCVQNTFTGIYSTHKAVLKGLFQEVELDFVWYGWIRLIQESNNIWNFLNFQLLLVLAYLER